MRYVHFYKSLVTRNSAVGRLCQAISTRMTGNADMAMPLMRGIGPTLHFGEPIDTAKPKAVTADEWVASVKKRAQQSLETILTDLLAIPAKDPFRELNPLTWSSAADVA